MLTIAPFPLSTTFGALPAAAAALLNLAPQAEETAELRDREHLRAIASDCTAATATALRHGSRRQASCVVHPISTLCGMVVLQQAPSTRQSEQQPCAAPLAAGPTVPGGLAAGPRGGEASKREPERRRGAAGRATAEKAARIARKAITPQ